MKCTLHIGAEKTGTKSIQLFLGQNREKLAERGVLVPWTPEKIAQHKQLVAYAQQDDTLDDVRMELKISDSSHVPDFREGYAKSIDDEIANVPPGVAWNHAVFSSEHCQSRLRTLEEISFLKDFLSERFSEIKILVYFRRQDRMALSFHSTYLKSGGTDEALLLEVPESHLPYYLDFHQIAQNWAQVFSKDAVIVKRFEKSRFKNGDLLEDFCAALDLDMEGLQRPPRVNESLTPAAQEMLRLLNRQCPTFLDNRRNPLRQDLVSILERNYHGKGLVPARGEAEAYMQNFKESNQLLSDNFLDGEPAFDEDFSEYPVERDELKITLEDFAEITATLWNAKAAESFRIRSTANK